MHLEQDIDLIEQFVQMMYNAECQLILALPRVAERAESPELQRALQAHLDESERHATRLEKLATALDISCCGRRSFAMEGLLKDGEEIMGFGGPSILVDAAIISACRAVEAYEISQYRQLISLLGKDPGGHASTLEETLREEEQASRTLGVAGGHSSP